jgi:hypothetical protein
MQGDCKNIASCGINKCTKTSIQGKSVAVYHYSWLANSQQLKPKMMGCKLLLSNLAEGFEN